MSPNPTTEVKKESKILMEYLPYWYYFKAFTMLLLTQYYDWESEKQRRS